MELTKRTIHTGSKSANCFNPSKNALMQLELLLAHVYGSFCVLYHIPFTCKDKKDWPIKLEQLSGFPYFKAALFSS